MPVRDPVYQVVYFIDPVPEPVVYFVYLVDPASVRQPSPRPDPYLEPPAVMETKVDPSAAFQEPYPVNRDPDSLASSRPDTDPVGDPGPTIYPYSEPIRKPAYLVQVGDTDRISNRGSSS